MSRVLLTHEIMCRFATFAISARISPSKCFHAQVFRPFFLQTMYPEHKTLMVLLLLSAQTFTLTILQRTLKELWKFAAGYILLFWLDACHVVGCELWRQCAQQKPRDAKSPAHSWDYLQVKPCCGHPVNTHNIQTLSLPTLIVVHVFAFIVFLNNSLSRF